MTDAAKPPGPLIGSGRAADIYALGDGKVLRRYKTAHSCAAEAGLMRYLREAGYPVPEVFAAAGTDLVMQRLYGRDMLADLASRPWRVVRHARTLARLHDQLHQIAAPAGLGQFGRGGQVLHMDLHPANIMLTASGPFVIDWSNGCAGDRLARQARTHLASAAEISETDPAGGYTLVYDAARKALTAVLQNQGLRPTSRGGHLAVYEAIRAQLDPPMGQVLRPFDRIRRQRHDVEYPPADAPQITAEDVRDDAAKAAAMVDLSERILDQMSPF